MKKSILFCSLVLVFLVISFTSCKCNKMSAEDCGEEIISLPDEMIHSDEYIEMRLSQLKALCAMK